MSAMNSKRLWEIGAIAALLLVVAGAGGGFAYWRIREQQLNTQLLQALYEADSDAVRVLVRRGANVHSRVEAAGRATPVILAASHSDIELLRELRKRGAEINARDNIGFTGLTWAASHGDTAIALELVSAGADPNIRDAWGRTALMYAVKKGPLETVEVLLRAGADANLADVTRQTALSRAGSPEIILLLKQYGAQKERHSDQPAPTRPAPSRKGRSMLLRPLERARAWSWVPIVQRVVTAEELATPSSLRPECP